MLDNQQVVEKQQLDECGVLEVHSIFDTLQGEGPLTGTPAMFVRLAGCNLQCQLCDTDYTNFRKRYGSMDLYHHLFLQRNYPVRELVVITGGEPFRQNLVPFVRRLLQCGHLVQIETNGTLKNEKMEYWKGNEGLSIVCSPKTPKIHDEMWPWISELKYVVEAGCIDHLDGLPTRSVGIQYGRPARPPKDWQGQIFVQPLDHQDPIKNAANNDAAVQSCLKFGYRLCLQIQKIVNLP